MIAVYVLLLLLMLYRIRLVRFNQDYLSFDSTNAIKGIFILFVFISHFNGSAHSSGAAFTSLADRSFDAVQHLVGQWIVALFLFYSGYGIVESIRKKGETYVNRMPRHRMLTVLLNFDVAVLVFVLVGYLLGYDFGWQKIVLALVGWESVGNSHWYIFVIMICYLLAYLAFKLTKCEMERGLKLCLLFVVAAMVALYLVKDYWWYNTMLCFPFGMAYSHYRKKLESFFFRHFKAVILLALAGYVVGYVLTKMNPLFYNISALAVVVLVVTGSMKVSVCNRPLVWLGSHLFPIYIYQRIPMLIFCESGLLVDFPLFPLCMLCLAITLLIAYGYKYWQITLH